ncbi:hypothetical protein SDC9_153149 [bioreactor metagenome]|uniref:Uncharacterized protein n=1 Tax=bioreactor metagenome TaxID=1076179 RepID=A0A645EV49_9ZZZZ
MNPYNKVNWQDHLVDEISGEVIQQGTPLSRNTLDHMDEGIKSVTDETLSQEGRISQLEAEVRILKDATLNNMTNNVFLETFSSINSIKLSKGVYDSASRKIYI